MNSNIHVSSFCNIRYNDLDYFHKRIDKYESNSKIYVGKHLPRRTSSYQRYHLLRTRKAPIKVLNNKIRRYCRKVRRRRFKYDTIGRENQNNMKNYLETHLWHCKRFHMKERYGYMLPTRHKNLSCTYLKKKVFSDGVVIHDCSYYSVLELKGLSNDLISFLGSYIVSYLQLQYLLLTSCILSLIMTITCGLGY